MREIIINTQEQFDALPKSFDEYTKIIIKDTKTIIQVAVARDNSSVVACGNSSVVAWGNSSVEAWGNSSVVACGNSSVEARGNSSVEARGNSSVEARDNSSVEAWGNSSVEAWDNSSVEAWGNSSVEAWGNSSVVACGNSSVVAWDNSSVEAWDNSSVVARENSSVVAWGNSSVEARGNSSVEAWGNVAVRVYSVLASITLFGFSVAWNLCESDKIKSSINSTIINAVIKNQTVETFLDAHGVELKDKIIVYKRVSKELKTQEGTNNETTWKVGKKLEVPNWNPTGQECGEGKFHACTTTYFCDEFRSLKDDRYIAIEVAKEDLYAWPKPAYPHKIAFKKGKVLYEADKKGKKIEKKTVIAKTKKALTV
jgi:hypothetical protein